MDPIETLLVIILQNLFLLIGGHYNIDIYSRYSFISQQLYNGTWGNTRIYCDLCLR